MTFEAENDLDFRLGTGALRGTKPARPGDGVKKIRSESRQNPTRSAMAPGTLVLPCAEADGTSPFRPPPQLNNGAITRLTMAITLIRMFIEGPDVSLKGSPTVSPTTVA